MGLCSWLSGLDGWALVALCSTSGAGSAVAVLDNVFR